ncbi:MAG: amino acid adenylation domain-containing protein [Chloroflexi bacterium]|nr:amino acid adenylation domain-containing protein [Chloroflexota bacterium]
MTLKNIEDVYPLAPMQQGMVFHSIAAPESGVYVEQLSCTLRGDLNVRAFERAWQCVVDRHAILRTAFIGTNLKEPVQVVHRHAQLPFEFQDWRGISPSAQLARLDAFLATERRRGFALAQPPLMRVALMRVTDTIYEFVWLYHHALLDGWSAPMALQDVFAFYDAFAHARDLHLPAPPPYRDYIVWLKQQPLARAETFWRAALAGFTTTTPLVVERANANAQGARVAEVETHLAFATTNDLQTRAREQRLTLNTLAQGAWALVLSRYSGEDDVVFGATVSGRPPELSGAAEMVGVFINTLPVRARVPRDQSLATWLSELQTQQIEMRQYEYTPLAQIQQWSAIPRGAPLFESILVFENVPVGDALRARDTGLEILNVRSVEQTNYPITAVAGPSSELLLKLVYDAARFDKPTMTRMVGHWRALLEEFAANPQLPISNYQLLTPAEREQILVEWNTTAADFPREQCAPELFKDQVARAPDAIALTLGDAQMTYRELNARANQLANHLRAMGIAPETIVAICVERSFEMIVAVLGVLKAGGAYLPLDPTYPADRLAFVLEDSGAPILITQANLVSHFTFQVSARVLCLDAEWDVIARTDDSKLASAATPDNLAYVIYTSGSTGKPKGTLLEHRGLSNLITEYARAFGIGASSRVLQFFSFGFDGSVADIFSALLNGATLCLVPPNISWDATALRELIETQRVNVALLPPAALALLAPEELPSCQTIISGGESCRPELATRWARGRKFFNAYGPTEATVAVSWYRVNETDGAANIPIGRPIANTQLYILDSRMQPVPIGVPGELYVGGVGLARGYLNRPDLTAEKFVTYQLPFTNYQLRLYKTGDLARYRADGNIEFLGRIDHQVKLRGFRIELGEIETLLREHPAVRDAVPFARHDSPGEKRLVAYVIARENLEGLELREFLRAKLPAYMLPSAFVMLENLPLNASGKVDRRALPAPDVARAPSRRVVIAPRDPVELKLARIWETVLGAHSIGIKDDFFELGGHSLLALRLIAQIQHEFGKPLPLASLFQEPTIEHLARLLRDEELTTPVLVPLQPTGSKPPVFFVHPSGGSVHWYTELANYLGADQPFYGLQARGIYGDTTLHTRVEEMASYYVDALRAFQPAGPYRLGSWSMGVAVAYEMAQQLRAQAQPVTLLAMLDQTPTLAQPQPPDDAAYLVDLFGQHLALSVEQLRALAPRDQIASVWRAARQADWLYPEVTLEQFSHFVRVLRTHLDAFRNYQPQRYDGKVTLFRAAERPADDPPTPDLGWGELANAGVEIHDVPGDHLSMIHEPHVQILAEQLAQCLDQT